MNGNEEKLPKDARFDTVSTTTSGNIDRAQRRIQPSNLAGLENISLVKNYVAERSSRMRVHVFSDFTLCVGISNPDPSNNWATKLEDAWNEHGFAENLNSAPGRPELDDAPVAAMVNVSGSDTVLHDWSRLQLCNLVEVLRDSPRQHSCRSISLQSWRCNELVFVSRWPMQRKIPSHVCSCSKSQTQKLPIAVLCWRI